MKGFPRLGTLIGMLILSIMVLGIPQEMVSAQGCSISKFESSHYGQVSLGTWIVLKGESNCGTVRYTVNGAPRAEIGNGSQTETIKTEEFGTGTFELCFVGRGDGGWENATRSCTSIYVQGSQGAPPGSESGGNVKCWVNNFSVTPATVKKGQTINFSGYGQCDGNARAARFYINGNPYGEYGGNTTSATWNTSDAGVGSYEICFGITGGEWSQEARSCVGLNVLAPDAPPPTPSSSQGPQSDNGQQGQTDQSGPNNAGNQPTQPQQPAQPSNPPQGNNSGGNQGGSGGGSGNCPTNLSRLSVGSIAKINDTDPSPAKVRSGPGTGHAHIDNRAVRTLVTIIGGPACGNGWVWWEVGYDGKSGWIAEVDSRRLYNLVPNGSAPSSQGNTGGNTGSNSGSGSSNPPPSSPPTGGRPQTCPSVPARLRIGQSGRNIIDGRGSTNVRQTPGGFMVTQMAEGTTFTVTDGPFCLRADNGQAIRWFKIRMDNGTEGWAPEAVNNRYVLEPWGGNTNEGSGRESQVVEVGYYYSPFDTTYIFRVDVSDKSNCVILNGSSIVAQEINRSSSLFSSILADNPLIVADELRRYLTNNGDIDTFRVMVDSLMVRKFRCLHTYYQVGNGTMDLYGLGNVLFGFYADKVVNEWVAYRIGDIFQVGESHRLDFPDDTSQIKLGIIISRANRNASTALVESQITDDFVSSR